MEKLVIVRSNPEQGKPVRVQFRQTGAGYAAWSEKNDDLYGKGEFPFPLWLQFEKLLKDGMEARARTETRETRRIEVEFRPLAVVEAPEAPEAPVPQTLVSPIAGKIARSLGGVSNLAKEEGDE